jgi:hypothetical protein
MATSEIAPPKALDPSISIDPRPTAWFLSQGGAQAEHMIDILKATGARLLVFERPEDGLPLPKSEANHRDDNDLVTWNDEQPPEGERPDIIVGTGYLALHDVMDGKNAYRSYSGKGLAKLWNIPYVNVQSSKLQVVVAEWQGRPVPAYAPDRKTTARISKAVAAAVRSRLSS